MSGSGNLSPLETAEAAQAVYRVRLSNDVVSAFEGTTVSDKFTLTDGGKFTGKSGIFRSTSGFGVIAEGSGVNKGEVMIVTRGTKTLSDWYSNARIKTTLSANQKSVHSGFNSIFHSFKDDLRTQLRILSPTRIHCVGHSLGGALATLIAEWVNAEKLAQHTHIYTFGCPRVGTQRFVESLTSNLGKERVNRAYHKTDVVPMIPLWPYMHGPMPGTSCFIDSPGNFPGAKYHDMDFYIDSAEGHKKWDSLRRKQPNNYLENQVEAWLDSDSPLSLTGNTIFLISAAIRYVITKLALAGVQFIIGEGVNMVDGLACFLVKAAAVAKETFELVAGLMKRILSALGIVMRKTENITYSFVRWALDMLSASLNKIVALAMSYTHRGL